MISEKLLLTVFFYISVVFYSLSTSIASKTSSHELSETFESCSRFATGVSVTIFFSMISCFFELLLHSSFFFGSKYGI